MVKVRHLLVVLLALALIAPACKDDEDSCGEDTTAEDTAGVGNDATIDDDVILNPGSDLTFHVITHGDGGPFWSVVRRGAMDASVALGVTVIYRDAHDPTTQVQLIEAAVEEGSDGIAVSLASPEVVGPAAQAVVAAGIPLFTLNSGMNFYKELGATTHIGQSEIIAGNGAGERFNALGANHVLCARQEEANVGLEERCTGLAETFQGEVTSEFVGFDSDFEVQMSNIASILEDNPDIDAVLATGGGVAFASMLSGENAGRALIIGSFDLFPDIIDVIEAGGIDFTIDQQQYLQGYLPVVLMYLQATNLNVVGGGQPVLTGPDFITSDNAAEVRALVEAGTR